jgi:hypothetical protein
MIDKIWKLIYFPFYLFWLTPTFLEGFKCESKNENNKRRKSQGCVIWFVALLGVRWACWNVEMGTRMNDKWVNYSFEPAQIKQQVG